MAVELIPPEAEQDISEAYDWYKRRRLAGEEFSVASTRVSIAFVGHRTFTPRFMRSFGGL